MERKWQATWSSLEREVHSKKRTWGKAKPYETKQKQETKKKTTSEA